MREGDCIKKYKKGDRVWHEKMGYGTVTVATYNTIHFTTYTGVKFDDYLGQIHSLCCKTEELILEEEFVKE